jgi:SagB-type dehydrogenase family enzyme
MNRIDLASPFPRDIETPYGEFPYAIEDVSYLPEPNQLPEIPFQTIISLRESRRTFTTLLKDDLNSLLWHSARALIVAPTQSTRWQHRPTPSAGGRHPIDILILNPQDTPLSVNLYQPESHALAKLTALDVSSTEKLIEAVDEVMDPGQATMIWFGAQFERTLSKYEYGESLVWRDAGALLAVISLVAECLSFNCCAIGITGEPFISQILSSNRDVVGVGGLLVGRGSKPTSGKS